MLTWKFLGRKLAIIMPWYFVAWLIGFVSAQFIARSTIKEIWKNLILSVPVFLQLEMLGVPCYQVLSPTWHVSAMMVAILFIYPLLLIKGREFRTIAAPAIIAVSYGYLAVKVGNLATIEPLEGSWIHSGLFRAFGGLSMGVIAFEIAQNILPSIHCAKEKLTVIELGCYGCALLSMRSQTIYRPDFVVVLLLGIAVTLSFSGKTCTGSILPNPPKWLGQLSLSIYLIDAPVRTAIKYLMPDEMDQSRYVPCVVLTIALGIVTLLGGNLTSQAFNKFRQTGRETADT